MLYTNRTLWARKKGNYKIEMKHQVALKKDAGQQWLEEHCVHHKNSHDTPANIPKDCVKHFCEICGESAHYQNPNLERKVYIAPNVGPLLIRNSWGFKDARSQSCHLLRQLV